MLTLVIALLGAAPALTLSSCGTTRSYWGIENEYDWGDGFYDGYKKPHHPKKKKYKKRKKHGHDHDRGPRHGFHGPGDHH